jgi:hypothetical protein
MRLKNKEILFLTFLIIMFLFISCKRDIAGCTDIEATNWSTHANLNDGSCNYRPLISDPSFERGDWSTYSGKWYSPYAYQTDQADGFMPTAGKYYFKCTPPPYYRNGTSTKLYIGPNKHYKGIYFDYSYYAKASDTDSVLNASAGITYRIGSKAVSYWVKYISENSKTFGGFPAIEIKVRDEYLELPYNESEGTIHFGANVTSGTFTFCIDNIREVKR